MADEGWIEWVGGKCPVPADTLVQIRFAAWSDNGSWRDIRKNPPARADQFNWSKRCSSSDIIAYRVVQS